MDTATFINNLRSVQKFVVLSMILLSACSIPSTTRSVNESILQDDPCAAPCWYGLEPGRSTEEDVLMTLAILPFVDSEMIHKYGTVWQEDESAASILFGCIHPKIKDCGEALTSDGKLMRLRLPPPDSLTLDSVVHKHGPPDYVTFEVLYPTGGCVVILNWSDSGISIWNVSEKSRNLCQTLPKRQKIPSNTKVTEVFYFEKLSLDIKMNNNKNNMVEWPGFE